VDIVNININQGITKFTEILFLFITLVYTLYAFLLIKNVKLMNKVLNTPKSGVFKFFALVHLVMAVSILVIASLIII